METLSSPRIIPAFSVKISFLELYNEEIFDLLSGIEDTSKLRLYEDAYKKGSVIIQVTLLRFILCYVKIITLCKGLTQRNYIES